MLALALLAGCGRHGGSGASAPAAPQRKPRVAAAPTAFDLALLEGGALLAWAKPRADGGGVWLQALDAAGVVRAEPRRVAQTDAGGDVLELAATAVGRRVGVAWIESDASESRTRALLVLPDERALPEPTRIATGAPLGARSRSHFALTGTPEGRLRVLYADAPTECVDRATGPCTAFGFREIGPGARPLGGQWLAVPQPCAQGAPSLTASTDRLYYAVCATRDGAPSTVAYSINVQTEYARADEVLAGCDPLGMLALDGGALLVGDCGGERRGVELTLAPQPPVERVLSEREVRCDGALASLRATNFALPLRGARERVELALPDELAPPGARAVWTGRALLIAHPAPAGIELVRLACSGGALRAIEESE